MQNLERGWAMVAGEGHGAALLIVLLVGGLVVVATGMWLAVRASRRRVPQDHLGRLLRDHHGRRVRVARRDARHHRRVGDP